jgi:hypothetical protein
MPKPLRAPLEAVGVCANESGEIVDHRTFPGVGRTVRAEFGQQVAAAHAAPDGLA